MKDETIINNENAEQLTLLGTAACYPDFCGNNDSSRLKVLNLYAGIGGNRKLWKDVDVTAVELNPEIANIYSDFYPDDKIVVGDAHEFLIEHYMDYDFIWSSPPCPTHSRARYWGSFRPGYKPVYPDMKLYQEIILLKHNAKCLWVIENVYPYYKPLIGAKKIGRHLFWSNFEFDDANIKTATIGRVKNEITLIKEITGFDLSNYKIKDKRKILRNCVIPEIGLHLLECAKRALPPMHPFVLSNNASKNSG